MAWGTDMEAVAAVSFILLCKTTTNDQLARYGNSEFKETGLHLLPNTQLPASCAPPDQLQRPFIGGSPDLLIGNDAGAEFKCLFREDLHPELKKQPERSHVCQAQWCMLSTNRRVWFICYYTPKFLQVFRLEYDAELCSLLAQAASRFVANQPTSAPQQEQLNSALASTMKDVQHCDDFVPSWFQPRARRLMHKQRYWKDVFGMAVNTAYIKLAPHTPPGVEERSIQFALFRLRAQVNELRDELKQHTDFLT